MNHFQCAQRKLFIICQCSSLVPVKVIQEVSCQLIVQPSYIYSSDPESLERLTELCSFQVRRRSALDNRLPSIHSHCNTPLWFLAKPIHSRPHEVIRKICDKQYPSNVVCFKMLTIVMNLAVCVNKITDTTMDNQKY